MTTDDRRYWDLTGCQWVPFPAAAEADLPAQRSDDADEAELREDVLTS